MSNDTAKTVRSVDQRYPFHSKCLTCISLLLGNLDGNHWTQQEGHQDCFTL